MEYRIQRLDNGEWRFIPGPHGYPYTYNTLETAKRFGPQHGPRRRSDDGKWVLVPEKFRIVYGEWTGTVV